MSQFYEFSKNSYTHSEKNSHFLVNTWLTWIGKRNSDCLYVLCEEFYNLNIVSDFKGEKGSSRIGREGMLREAVGDLIPYNFYKNIKSLITSNTLKA